MFSSHKEHRAENQPMSHWNETRIASYNLTNKVRQNLQREEIPFLRHTDSGKGTQAIGFTECLVPK